MELIAQRVKLREFVPEDFIDLREMDLLPELHTFEREMPSEAETQKSLNESISSQSELPRTNYRLAITIPPKNRVMGILKFARQWEAIREWEIGWAIHPAEWGKGYATEAARCVIDWAFEGLNVHRIVAYCHALNTASVRVMEKLGMRQDGKLRSTRWMNGEWWDEYVYAILDRDWKDNKPNLPDS
jgi:RimJ/RimL family protein N-acetyltransferase